MRSITCGLILFALSSTSFAIEEKQDGTIVMTKEEAQAMINAMRELSDYNEKLKADIEKAKVIFQLMDKDINRLEEEKKSAKCV